MSRAHETEWRTDNLGQAAACIVAKWPLLAIERDPDRPYRSVFVFDAGAEAEASRFTAGAQYEGRLLVSILTDLRSGIRRAR